MSYTITEGSGQTMAADVYGSAAAPSSSQQIPWVGLAPGTAGALAPVSKTNPVHVADCLDVVTVTLSTDTSAYASGDLLADAQEVASAALVSGGAGELVSLMVLDEDDQGVAFDIYLVTAATSWGTENAAPTITDAIAQTIVGHITVATGDYKDLGDQRIAFYKNIGLVYETSGSTSLYVVVVNGSGTPTFAADGLTLKFGFKKV